MPGNETPAQPSPRLEITWADPVTGRPGYLVVDRFVRGLTCGGFRIRPGLTREEVRGLAWAMSLKEAIVYDPDDRYLPLGGAKGGVDAEPGTSQADGMTRRFLADLRPLLRDQWITGEDLGSHQDDLDAAAASVGLDTTVEALFPHLNDPAGARSRLDAALAVVVDGVPLAELVGGYGVAATTVAWARRAGYDPAGSTVAVQGFGSIGGAAARYLARAGMRVVAVSDRDGVAYHPDGLDVEALLATRRPGGMIDRRALRRGARVLAADRWLELPVDVLVPAAVSYAITAERAADVRARVVAEGANLPTVPDAERLLSRRGIAVIPDILANVATNAWWYWTLFGDVEPTAESGFAKISATLGRLLHTVADDADTGGTILRQAAVRLAEHNMVRVDAAAEAATAAVGHPSVREATTP